MTLPSTAPHQPQRAANTQPIRVCYVIDQLRRAGTELRLQRLIRALPREAVQPHLCLLRERGEMADGEVADRDFLEDCPTIELGLHSFRSAKTIPSVRRFRQFLKQHQIDIVELYFRDAVLFGAPVARMAGVRHVVRTAFNLGYWMTRTDHALNYLTRPLINHAITNCESGRAAAMANFRVPADKTTVLTNGIELQRLLEVPPARSPLSDSPHIGMVANLRPVKGIADFIEAARILVDRRPTMRFTVAGDGELRAELQQRIAERGLSGNVELVGRVSEIADYLAQVDIAVLASHSEGMSNSLIEYLAAARPVVATDVGGAREVLEQGRFGLLVPPREPGQLAEAIDTIVNQYEVHAVRAEEGRDHVAARYGTQQMARQFTQFYHSLLGIPFPEMSDHD